MTGIDPLPRVPVSWGELVDKKTILEIKVERLRDPDALANARRELAPLEATLATLSPTPPELDRWRRSCVR